MSALGKKLRQCEGGVVTFKCPGCNSSHSVSVNSGVPGRDWAFNGDGDKPTFSPSVLVRGGHYLSEHKPGDGCWCTFNKKNPDRAPDFKCERCHSFVRDGAIQFLDDCSHALAGQTVDLPDFHLGE